MNTRLLGMIGAFIILCAALALIAVGAIMGFVAILNACEAPFRRLARIFAARGEEMPDGYTQVFGLPISVLLLIVVAIAMTIIAQRTRFGRHILATGGDPDAADLSGIAACLLNVKSFALVGVLCAISAIIAPARLTNHSNDLDALDELRVIAAGQEMHDDHADRRNARHLRRSWRCENGRSWLGRSAPRRSPGPVGHNSGGKSTLFKNLSGAYPKDSGEILINSAG